jgi:Spy/CpxP family protein refolding chaperone
MKKLHIYSLLLAAVIGLMAMSAFGQDGPPPDDRKMGPPPDGQGPPPNGRQGDRGQLLRELGLSQEQFQQIRRMNQERKPLMEAAHRRLDEANRALDQAIYADTLNEQDIEAKVKEAQAAQSEMVRLRYLNELQVRKILTPEQLVKFRDLRDKFERMRENFKERMDDRRPNMPPMNNQNLRPPGNQRPINQRPGGRPL